MGGLGDKEKGRNRRAGRGQDGIGWDRREYGKGGGYNMAWWYIV